MNAPPTTYPSAGDAAGRQTVPEQGRAAQTAEKLRAAARVAFAEHGYPATRVADIVDEADVSHGTFYTYYVNKPAILEDLVRTVAERLHAIAEAPWEGPDVRATLEEVIGNFIDAYAEDGDVIRAWVEAAAVESRFADLLRELREGFVKRVASNLEPVAIEGGYDPVVAASALVSMVEGFAIEHFPAASRKAREDAARTLAAIWHGGLHALSEPPPSP